MTIVLSGTAGITTPTTSTTGEFVTSVTGFKNRIINGAMVIDQRNAGAEVNPAANATYYLDRWRVFSDVASKFKIGQNAGSVTPPAGYINYLGCTSLSSYTVGTSEGFGVAQRIEGLNIADLAWGTASAATVTLSFLVYSSLTGTFGGSLRNNGNTRSCPFSYSIPVANTWTTISVTVAGDTSGTWFATNGIGIAVSFSLGSGATVSGTAGAWAATNYFSATGATSVVGTNGATFYITGVQLEKGSTATSFDYRPYGTELSLCQRYYQKSYAIETVPASVTKLNIVGGAVGLYGVWAGLNSISFAVQMRAAPTFAYYDSAGNASKVSAYLNTGGWTDNLTALYTIPLANTLSTNAFVMGAYNPPSSGAQNNNTFLHYTASAEL